MVDLNMRLLEDYDVQFYFPDPVINAGAPSGQIEITSNGVYDVSSYASADVAVPEPSGTINITSNGTYNVSSYASADVAVPEPSGTINITSNGTYNVSSYASADVVVPEPSGTINITSNGTTDVSAYQYASVTDIGKTALLEETIEVTPASDQSSLTFNHHLGVIPEYMHVYMEVGFDGAPNSTTTEWHCFRMSTQVENVNYQITQRKASGGTAAYNYTDHIAQLTDSVIDIRLAASGSPFRAGYKYICKCFGNIIIGSETDVSQ